MPEPLQSTTSVPKPIPKPIKKKGRPKGRLDTPGIRSQITIEERLKIIKELIQDKELSARERLEATRLYSDLCGDRKKDGFAACKLVFEVIPDIRMDKDFVERLNRPIVTSEQIGIQEEELTAPKQVEPEPFTEEERFDNVLIERDKERKKQNEIYESGDDIFSSL